MSHGVTSQIEDQNHSGSEELLFGVAQDFANHEIGLFDIFVFHLVRIEAAHPHQDHLLSIAIVSRNRQECPTPTILF